MAVRGKWEKASDQHGLVGWRAGGLVTAVSGLCVPFRKAER